MRLLAGRLTLNLGLRYELVLPLEDPLGSAVKSRRLFFRLRFRANACLTRFLSPGFK